MALTGRLTAEPGHYHLCANPGVRGSSLCTINCWLGVRQYRSHRHKKEVKTLLWSSRIVCIVLKCHPVQGLRQGSQPKCIPLTMGLCQCQRGRVHCRFGLRTLARYVQRRLGHAGLYFTCPIGMAAACRGCSRDLTS